MSWSEEFKSKRVEYGLTQAKICELAGIHEKSLSAFENGKRSPSDKLKKKLDVLIEKFNPKYKMYAIFDYFRVRFPTHNYEAVIEKVLQMKIKYFTKAEFSSYGYKEQYNFSDIFVMTSDDTDGRGTLIELKGKGCRRLEYLLVAQHRTWKDFIISCLSFDGVFKRIDIAINDTAGILDIEDLMSKVGTDKCKMIFSKYQRISSSETLRNEVVDCKIGEGNTLYVGSMKSEIYFCIYEKDYEQYIKNGIPIEDADVKNRFEIRLKNDRAYNALMDYIEFEDMERTAFGIINRYICFYEEENKKDEADWDIDYRWNWFIGNGREKIKLTMQPEPYTIEKTRRWIVNQISPSISLLDRIDKFDGTHLVDMVRHVKLPDKQKRIYEQYTSSVYDVICGFEDIEKNDITLFDSREVIRHNNLEYELNKAMRLLKQREEEVALLRSKLKNKGE